MPEGTRCVDSRRRSARSSHTSAYGSHPPRARSAADAEALDGATLQGADAAGKHLFVEFEGERFVDIHLGLIGHFDIHRQVDEVPPPQGAVRLRIATTRAYADLRGAIICDLVGPVRVDQVMSGLGPDPLRPDADPARAWARISRSDRSIGDLLMDQAVLAGVGNVYRAEVLFRHRIHPLRPGRTLRRSQFEAIWVDLVELMQEGVRLGRIDTVRPEHTPEVMGREPRRDDHGGEVYVYRRTGQPCLVCGSPVRTEALAGPSSFWCGRCQPKFRSRAGG